MRKNSWMPVPRLPWTVSTPRLILLIILIFAVVVQARITDIYDTGIQAPYQGKSTHNYEDFYTYYAQSFVAPETWLIDLSIPLFKNDNNESKNNPDFTIELWDDADNVLAQSIIYAAPINTSAAPVYYDLGITDIELTAGNTYWAVYNPLSDIKEEAWCGFYQGANNVCSGYFNKQHFAPTDTLVTGVTLYAYYMTFSPEAMPEPCTIVILGIGSLLLRKKK